MCTWGVFNDIKSRNKDPTETLRLFLNVNTLGCNLSEKYLTLPKQLKPWLSQAEQD